MRISLQSFISYLFIKHYYTRVETITPEQEEGEPDSEVVGDDISVENQGRHICIFYPPILDHLSIYVLFVHELPYVSMFRT